MIERKHYWVVMTIQDLRDTTFAKIWGLEARIVVDQEPYFYLPVFTSREAAIEWNGGEDNIFEVQEVL